ncbi:transcription cofactor vestigial-like protein 1 [Cricetulus griseus]|uniref:Transcription cofactor vestigial-like protein 1 n=1 Tax=Cricetulus griseus TaxID=10029 RepID=A0A061I0M6_CRIGR|nr:transcription cofactor vestigial-like protein 1 [Cricetulus griseus]
MDKIKKIGVQMPKSRQKPVKTEWNARCVIFSYFQGDISSVVDEHFSRALSNLKRSQRWSSLTHGENVILRNDSSMPPNQWRLTSSSTKPQPEASLVNGASSSNVDESGPEAIDQCPLSMPKTPSAHPQEMWQLSPLERQDFLEPTCSRALPDRHPAPEVYPDGRRGSLLALLQQDRYLNRPLEPATRENCNHAKIAGSTGLHMNLPPNSDHYKKMDRHGSAGPSIDNERSQSPERRDLYYY